MDLNKLSAEIHRDMISKGFWDERYTYEHHFCLVITEISEAVEADRKERHADYRSYKSKMAALDSAKAFPTMFERYLKDTVEDELVDVVIRLLDVAGDYEVDFEKMHELRYHRAFNRWTFTENAFALTKGLTREGVCVSRRILFGITFVREWAKALGFNLDYAMREKMNYNKQRQWKNGKLY